MIIGFDWGNAYTKLVTPNQVITYPSDIIPYRKIKVANSLREHDFIFKYRNRSGFAGTLAQDERSAIDRTRKGDTKLHEDALIRLLIGLHQFADKHIQLVVGQPINRHSDDKERIKDMVKGLHYITVNGVEKEIIIKDVVVGVEGGSALFSNPKRGTIHLIDVGSGTINFATVKDGRFINQQSDTIPKGIENSNLDHEALAQSIQNVVIDLDWRGDIYLVGGGAHVLDLPYPLFQPTFQNSIYGPEFANAIGYYRIGEQLWAR